MTAQLKTPSKREREKEATVNKISTRTTCVLVVSEREGGGESESEVRMYIAGELIQVSKLSACICT